MRHVIKDKSKLVANKLRVGEHKRVNPTAFKGYPGLANTANIIAQYIPKCETFMECFAGLGRIAKYVQSHYTILNDLGDYSVNYCKKNFRDAYVLQEDYRDVAWLFASKTTYRFYDPPWDDGLYEDNPLTRNVRNYKIIYNEILQDTPKLEGDWMVAGAVTGPLTKWPNITTDPNGFHHHEVQSRKNALFGLKARTYLVSNKPFVNHWQASLF